MQQLKQNVIAKLGKKTVTAEMPEQQSSAQQQRLAAVLLPFYLKNNEPWVLFTQRSKQLKHHSGQISFPGGAVENVDKNLADTALRETFEEIGVSGDKVELWGQMESMTSLSGFHVTPIIGELNHGFHVVKDDSEVAEVFGVPFAFFQNLENRSEQHLQTESGQHRYYLYRYQNRLIWGLTAQIIVQLLHILEQ